MSWTTNISVDDQGFWVVDDAFSVWLGYLVDQAGRVEADPWLAEEAEAWRVAAEVTDFGVILRALTPEQSSLLLAVATEARRRAREAGDVPRDFTRTGKDHVEVGRILEVADGFVELLDGTFPADPPTGAWFLGNGEGWAVMPVSQGALNKPRFAR